MRTPVAGLAAFALIGSGACWSAETANMPTYSSQKPLYAKIALTRDASGVLLLAFDESAGTGGGYDTIYADVNLNGNLADEKPMKGTLEKRDAGSRTWITYSFAPIDLRAPQTDSSAQGECLRHVSIRYRQYRPRRPGPEREGRAMFDLEASASLIDQTGEWEYSFNRYDFLTAESPEKAPLVHTFGERGPALRITAMPDPAKRGCLGIAARLVAGGSRISWTKRGKPTRASVQIVDERGKAIISHSVRFDRLSFG